MLTRPIMRRRMDKWSTALIEFDLVYMPQKAIKGQALADFLVDHPCQMGSKTEELAISLSPLKLYFDGSKAKAYNKKVKPKSFHEGELVWKLIWPIGTKDPLFGKWSPTWCGPFLVSEIFYSNSYRLMDINGEEHVTINGKYLKRYKPPIWN